MHDVVSGAPHVPTPETAAGVESREGGLQRGLSQRQLTMIGIGGAIGTGLFMGSGLAVGYAGPGVLLSYIIAAAIALVVMYSLSEMAVAHPTAGSFGTYAEQYVSPLAGFVVRYTYWATMVILIGSEAVAIGHYMEYWIPGLPIWVSTAAFGAGILWVNTRAIGNFGSVEYWLSAIKVTAIIAFILFGLASILGLGVPAKGIDNYFVAGGPLPFGFGGVWMAVLIAIFSFFGIEMIAVASGEAEDPQKSVPHAMKTMLIRLVLFYILAIGIIVAIVPWTESGAKLVTQSPFVKVFAGFGFPAAAHVMNFVVLSAALSAMNSSLYMASRMVFSLARAGHVPAGLGVLSARGVPVRATVLSSVGVVIAAGIALFSPRAFQYLVGISLFGGLFTWIAILVTHLRFRKASPDAARAVRAPLYPVLQLAGLALLFAILVTMALDSEFWSTAVMVGVPWLLLCCAVYAIRRAGRA
ncbi:amino acid permease [Sphingomonas sp. KC8]|uniref:amino acid permease n=1 Tax=Sphingomonas sp. KC8 TaxID=1030157 RepID=UPI0002489FEE|nr:amino acid permease [Sphingomonas sp. KC8]ARS27901.1 amino acid permease [Sphingomonas sp. KC8]